MSIRNKTMEWKAKKIKASKFHRSLIINLVITLILLTIVIMVFSYNKEIPAAIGVSALMSCVIIAVIRWFLFSANYKEEIRLLNHEYAFVFANDELIGSLADSESISINEKEKIFNEIRGGYKISINDLFNIEREEKKRQECKERASLPGYEKLKNAIDEAK